MNINEVLGGHVALDMECLDRMYLNAYVPNLQVAGQVVSYLTAHLGNPVPSPALVCAASTPVTARFPAERCRSRISAWAGASGDE